MINNEYLYHFTSSENLIRILETMSLKLSDFKKLNDLNEIIYHTTISSTDED